MLSASVKVGFTVVVATILLFAITIFMGVWSKKTEGVNYYIVFENVSGLQVGASVLKSGVKVGKVVDIQVVPHSEPENLRDKARVTVLLENKKETLTLGSGYYISSNLMGDKWIEIRPKGGDILKPCNVSAKEPWSEPYASGISPISVDDIMLSAEKTLKKVDEAVNSFNTLLGDKKLQDDLKEAVSNVKAAANSFREIAEKADGSISGLVDKVSAILDNSNELIRNVNGIVVASGGDIKDITSSVRNLLKNNESSINDLITTLTETSHSLNATMKSLETIVSDEKFGTNILGILENLEKTTTELNGIVEDVHGITSDQQLKDDLKDTLRETKETMEGANKLIKRARGILGDKDVASNGKSSRLVQLDADMLWTTQNGISAGNANLWLLPRGEHALKIGVDDIGEENKFNLQYGKNIGSFRPRIGVIRSKLGVGVDSFVGKNLELSVDAYNTRDVQVDLMGKYVINDSWYFMGGVRDAFDTKQGVVGVGKRF